MKRLIALFAVVAFAGCTVGPNYQRPPVTNPAQFYGQTGEATADSLADLPWWKVFNDPALHALIEEALRNGYDARIAAARVEEARAEYGISRSARYPSVDYNLDVLRAHTSKFDTPADVTGSLVVANVAVSWEADIWGRIRRLNEAARAQYLATEEGRRGVLLSLVSDVATSYFELRELDEELAIARRNSGAFQDTFDLFDRRLKGGAASALETSRAEAELAAEEAQIPLLERAIVAKENQIDFLLGRPPGPIERGAALEDVQLPPTIPAGLPASLLMRRPDVREAEQNLIASNANVGVANAALYPTLSLTGFLGGQSPELASLFGAGRAWEIEAGLLGPIFQGGRLRNQQRAAQARFEQAKLAYEQRITAALGEVSTALVGLQKLGEANTQRERAVHAERESVRLASLRYNSGLSAYFEVLDAQEQLLATENSLAQSRRDRLIALAQFYKSLGGGWQTEEATTPASIPAQATPAP